MTQPAIQFYHLLHSSSDRVLPSLLQKAYEAGLKCLVKCTDDAETKRLDDWLWEYQPASFLPHSAAAHPQADQQPIVLSHDYTAPNQAKVLMVVDQSTLQNLDAFDKVLLLFDGNDETALTHARQQWKMQKEAGHALVYWQQEPQGSWTKKHETNPES